MADHFQRPPILVQEPAQLNQMVAILRRQPRLGIDTESNSLYAYNEGVCLIQISIPNTDYLVDPITLPSIDCLLPLFADPSIEKIMHGAEYDVICLKRDFHFQIVNLFDTRVACRTLGYQHNGLADILAEEFGVAVNKRFQRANWGKRPLDDKLLNYARMDTHYLLPLRDRLAAELHAANRWEEACEESEWLTQIQRPKNGFDANGFWNIQHARRLGPQQLAVLRELYLFRDRHARRRNRPPFKILGDRNLLAIAQSMPKNERELSAIPKISPRQISRYSDEILAAVEKGCHSRPPHRPAHSPVDDAVTARFNLLRQWRKETAQRRQVESDVILPREIMLEIAKTAPHDRETLAKIMAPLTWRFETYGEEILCQLQGKSSAKTRQV